VYLTATALPPSLRVHVAHHYFFIRRNHYKQKLDPSRQYPIRSALKGSFPNTRPGRFFCRDQPLIKMLMLARHRYLHTNQAPNTCRSIKRDEPWRPPSYHGRHGDPLPAPMRRNIKANRLCNNATQLKLEHLIINIT